MREIFNRLSGKNSLRGIGLVIFFLAAGVPTVLMAQARPYPGNWATSTGVIGTIVIIGIVALIAMLILSFRLSSYFDSMKKKRTSEDKFEFSEELIGLDENEIDEILKKRKEALDYRLSGTELGSDKEASDDRGMIRQATHDPERPMFGEKKKGGNKD